MYVVISELVALFSFIPVISLSFSDSNACKLLWIPHSQHSTLVSAHPVPNFIDFIYLLSCLKYRRFSAIHSFLLVLIFFHTLASGGDLVDE